MCGVAPPSQRTIHSANDEFQLLEALLTNRNKRRRQGRFLVHGVRAINAAVAAGWPLEAVLVSERATSAWAADLVERAPAAEVIRLPAALLDLLSQREDGAEAVVVAVLKESDAGSTVWGEGPLVVAEEVKSPGNLGTIIRSADALGAGGVIVTGHAADLFDPACVRASTGALFSLPTATAASVGEVVDGIARRVVGLDPGGEVVDDVDLAGPLMLVAGTESTGLSRKAKDRCDVLASIPMLHRAASLNVGTAVAIALAEIARRRRTHGVG